jgi:hypothetical protein
MASLNHKFGLSERKIFLRGELDSSGKTGGGFFYLLPVEPVRATLLASRRAIRGDDVRAGNARWLTSQNGLRMNTMHRKAVIDET